MREPMSIDSTRGGLGRRLATLLAAGLVTMAGLTAAPQDPEALRRDQEQVLQRCERLRDLMQRLIERYRAENRTEQVELLQRGLRHLDEATVLEDVAGVRDSLRNQALAEALRKQRKVVEEMERLLAILRDRRSVENLEKEIEAAEQMAATASELLQRQTELQRQTRQAARGELTPAEQQLQQQIAQLAERQRQESQRNARDAGIRAPFLEEALRRVEQLLGRQSDLEQRAESEIEGHNDLRKEARERAFELGELEQRSRELSQQRAQNRGLERAKAAAERLEKALQASDAEAIRQAIHELQTRLDALSRSGANPGDRPAPELEKQLAEARPDQTEALKKVADGVREFADQHGQQLADKEAEARKSLREDTEKAAQKLANGHPPKAGSSAAATRDAAKALQEAAERDSQKRRNEADAKLAEAARALAEARQRLAAEHPDAKHTAQQMAEEAAQISSTLHRTPAPPQGGEAPEQDAAKQMSEAERALREGADQLRAGGDKPEHGDQAKKAVQQSRQHLEAAREKLQKALAAESAGREQQLNAGAARQQQLRQETQQLRERLQGASETLAPEQHKAAEAEVKRAEEQMQKAEQSLAKGEQSSAAQQQRKAAEALDRASEAIPRNRPVSREQRQALDRLAEQQKQLEDDIMRLARLAEERKNRDAKQALEQAAQAAQRAQKAMRDGERQEADQQQEQARQQLEKAKDALQEERDRYQDLRQEELLFKIKDELQEFLRKQRPITEETGQAGDALAGDGRMTRRLRKKMNELGKLEQELSDKAKYLRSALEEEGTLVFSHVLKSNEEDLADVAHRLGGRYPDPGELTNMLQKDVEERTGKLLAALEREQERRRQERNERQNRQGQQQSPGQQNQGPNRQRLVPILAELQMLKQMEQDLQTRTTRIQKLLETRADDITEFETALIERLGNRHNAITRIFLKLKAMLEEALDPASQAEDKGGESGEGKGEGKGKGKDKDKD